MNIIQQILLRLYNSSDNYYKIINSKSGNSFTNDWVTACEIAEKLTGRTYIYQYSWKTKDYTIPLAYYSKN